MKNALLLLSFFLVCATASTQNTKYTAAMTKTLVLLDSAQTSAQYTDVANGFSRIASAETKAWLPLYYAAFGHLQSAFVLLKEDPAKALETLDMAQANLDKALALVPGESELAVLQAYILIARVSENPMVNGQVLSPQVFAALGKAEALNPVNPRAAFLKGMYTMNMPEFYGGGAAKAKPLFEKAAMLYEQATSDALLPHWGKETNTYFLGQVGGK